MSKKGIITWATKLVNVADVRPTPVNYKIQTDLGKRRLAESLNKFGLAGTAVVNTDMYLIDGNSRLEEAKKKKLKKIWVSMPSRKLTAQEFKEMSAMFDFAKAGEVDLERIKGDLGNAKRFYEEWGIEVPLELLSTLGAGAKVERSVGKQSAPEELVVADAQDIRMVQLFFSVKQEAEFRKIEEVLKKKFNVDNTTDCVLKAFKSLKK